MRTSIIIVFLLFLTALDAGSKDRGNPRDKVTEVIIHAIGGPTCKDGKVVFTPAPGNTERWVKFFRNHAVLGIHYVIDKKGVVGTGIPENQVANHALGHNRYSIGIELVNRGDGNDPYTEEQLDALVGLLRKITKKWGLSEEAIKTHAGVDKRYFECNGIQVKKKQDPGAHFPFDQVIQRVFSAQDSSSHERPN